MTNGIDTMERNSGEDGRSRGGMTPTWERFFILICAATLLLILIFPLSIHEDCALYLQCAELLLEGKLPYVDFVEINPPLIMYLSAAPVLIAGLVHVHPILIFQLLIFSLSVWSAWAMRSLLLRAKMDVGQDSSGMMAIGWISFSLIMLMEGMYGQREHLFMLLFVPFLFVRWIRWNDGWLPPVLPTLIAIGAAAGVCLKPYFLIIVAAPELYWILSRRSLAPCIAAETIVFASAGLGYGAHFFFLPGEMREALFERWVPFIAAHYQVYNEQPLWMVRHYLTVFALGMAALPFTIVPNRPTPLWAMARPLSTVTLMATITFLMQRKGWDYHRIPSLGGSLLLLMLVFAQARPFSVKADSSSESAFHLRLVPAHLQLILLIAIGALGSFLGWNIMRGQFYPAPENPIAKFVAGHSAKGDSVLWISTSPYPALPTLVQLERRPGSRYLWSFPIPMFYSREERIVDGKYVYHNEEETSLDERRFLEELAEDIARNQPRLILVNKDCMACPEGFDLSEYLIAAGLVQSAMQGYEQLEGVPGSTGYILRMDQSGADGGPR